MEVLSWQPIWISFNVQRECLFKNNRYCIVLKINSNIILFEVFGQMIGARIPIMAYIIRHFRYMSKKKIYQKCIYIYILSVSSYAREVSHKIAGPLIDEAVSVILASTKLLQFTQMYNVCIIINSCRYISPREYTSISVKYNN